MTLKAVKGGWIDVDLEAEYEARFGKIPMIKATERKSKYKHKVVMNYEYNKKREKEMTEIHQWCEKCFGPGGRSKKFRWRRGWINDEITFYFKDDKDVTMFMLKWGV
jgi:hypothetical protein